MDTLVISQNLRQRSLGIDCDRCETFEGEVHLPDFILLVTGARARWSVVEMKSRVRDIGSVILQLQAGADAIDADERFAVPNSPRELTPLILHERRGAKAEDFVNRWVQVFGRKFPILQKRCGVALSEIIGA